MSRATLYVRFPDGTVRYGLYNGSADVVWPTDLHEHPADAWKGAMSSSATKSEVVPVRIATDYGGGFSWAGTAQAARVETGLDPAVAGGYEDGLPGWARYPEGVTGATMLEELG